MADKVRKGREDEKGIFQVSKGGRYGAESAKMEHGILLRHIELLSI